MRDILIFLVIIFAILVIAGRTDILRDIGEGARRGVDSIQNGYKGEQPNNKE